MIIYRHKINIKQPLERMVTKMTDRELKLKYWKSTVSLMDDEIREQVHGELAPCTNEEFLDRYEEIHFEKYGAEFVI